MAAGSVHRGRGGAGHSSTTIIRLRRRRRCPGHPIDMGAARIASHRIGASMLSTPSGSAQQSRLVSPFSEEIVAAAGNARAASAAAAPAACRPECTGRPWSAVQCRAVAAAIAVARLGRLGDDARRRYSPCYVRPSARPTCRQARPGRTHASAARPGLAWPEALGLLIHAYVHAARPGPRDSPSQPRCGFCLPTTFHFYAPPARCQPRAAQGHAFGAARRCRHPRGA